MKIIKAICIVGVFALTVHASQGKHICIPLEGEMGQELLDVINKYRKDLPDLEITVKAGKGLQKEEKRETKAPKAGKKQSEDDAIANGRKIYTNSCQSCHGDDGMERSYRSRPIANLSQREFTNAMRGYRNNTYDRGTAMIMQPHARGVSSSQISDIISYLESLKKEQ